MCQWFPTIEDWVRLFPAWGDFLRAIAWPLVAAFAIFFFRDQVRAAVDRLQEISPSGAKLGPRPQQPDATTPTSSQNFLEEAESVIDDAGLHDATLQPWREMIVNMVASLTPQVSAETMKSRLISTLALAMRRDSFHISLRWIYGSQLELLNRISGIHTVNLGFARELYLTIHVVRAAGKNQLTFEQWIEFLTGRNYITASTAQPWNEGASFSVTALGAEFSKFALELGETPSTRPL